MQQPQGFVDKQFPNYICRLTKSLYGLKQALRAWFKCFTSHLLTLGFVTSAADSSLFIRRTTDSITYLLLYVDDVIVTGSFTSYITLWFLNYAPPLI